MRSKQQGAAQVIALVIIIGFIVGNIMLDEYDAYKERQLHQNMSTPTVVIEVDA